VISSLDDPFINPTSYQITYGSRGTSNNCVGEQKS